MTINIKRSAGYDGMNYITNMGTNSYCNMRFGELHVYNTSLSAADVLQNFNARRGNYGL
jgi:hypothetical protein